MTRMLIAASSLITMAGLAFAEAPAPTPGPLLGAVAGPWGLAAGAVAYGVYRLYKAKR